MTAGEPRPWTGIYDSFYPPQTRARDILERHSRSVADLALEINRRKGIGLPEAEVELAAMLHDIGIFLTDAPSIGCFGSRPYLLHGVLGADLLRRHGFDEAVARVAERHTGSGITAEEIASWHMPFPAGRVLCPQSDLEQLVCYADKFYSKSGDMRRKPLDRVRASLARFGTGSLARFESLHARFSTDS